MNEQVRYSIEQCIRDHLAQDVDQDNAIVEASREIMTILAKPIEGPMPPQRLHWPAIGSQGDTDANRGFA